MRRLPEPIVVLGGGGFIGSNLVRRLLADGYRVEAVDVNPPQGPRAEATDGATTLRADLRDPKICKTVLWGAGTVFHLAADMGGVGYFHSDADFAASTDNGIITANVMQAIATNDVPLAFYASSACAYPVELQRIANRSVALEEGWLGHGTPDALYGAEKLHGLRIAAKLPQVRVGVLHTVYGPLQEHAGRRMKFPAAVATKALRARQTGELELWGRGNQLRSYCYVDDAIDMILRVMLAEHYEGPVNIGSAGAVSCREVAEICLRHVGAEGARIVTNEAEPTGVMSRDCSLVKFCALYGPAPARTYPDGFGAFIDWLDEIGVGA